MVRIILKNGSTLEVESMQFKGRIIDSNGTDAGGVVTYPFTEAEVNALDRIVPLQAAYNAVYPPKTEEQVESPEAESEQAEIAQGESE